MSEQAHEQVIIDGIPGFWDLLSAVDRKYLILDYDGTLAPFQADRMSAVPLDGVVSCLSEILDAGDTGLAVMSGRPVDEVLQLLGDLGLTMVGSHGWEIQPAGGARQTHRPKPAQVRRLDEAEKEAKGLGLGRRVERKTASVALHTRGMEPKSVAIVEVKATRLWLRGLEQLDMECRNFNGGVELLATSRNKGTALVELLAGEPSDTFCVYVGDDETDEDAFKQVARRGAGIRVGAPGVATNASGRLDGPLDVLRFLEEWIHVSAYARG